MCLHPAFRLPRSPRASPVRLRTRRRVSGGRFYTIAGRLDRSDVRPASDTCPGGHMGGAPRPAGAPVEASSFRAALHGREPFQSSNQERT
jgi:hypothetical protein